jgi:predicted PurR-regulated permease PerM
MQNGFELNKRNISFIALNAFGLFIIYLLSDFITPFLGALIFYVLFKPTMDYLVVKRKWREATAAILIILVSFIIVLVPIFVLSNMLYTKVVGIINQPEHLLESIKLIDARFLELTGRQLITPEMIVKLQESAGTFLPSFISKIFVVLGNIGMLYFMLYYMLIKRDTLHQEVNNYLPFNPENIKLLANELESQTLSNAIGVPLIAVIQGTAAGIGYWIFGLDEPVFWAVVTAFASILPLAGSTLIWVPASLFIMATQNVWMGVGLAVYGGLVIINIDNIARFTIQKKFADVHPLITVFGVIIGLNLFGIPGLIFGPLMLSYFIIFVKMYRGNYLQ